MAFRLYDHSKLDHMINVPWVIDDSHAMRIVEINPFDYNVLSSAVLPDGRCLISHNVVKVNKEKRTQKPEQEINIDSQIYTFGIFIAAQVSSSHRSASNFNKFEWKQHLNFYSFACALSCVQRQ